MSLALYSVPKRKENADGEKGGLFFCRAEEVIAEKSAVCAGRQVLYADLTAMNRLAAFGRGRRLIGVLAERDALPLFSLPDVGAIFAAGGENTLLAARFYAAVCRVPCYLFPTHAALYGAYGRGKVTLLGKEQEGALAEGEVFFDEGLLSSTYAEGYSALLLSKLARFEERALNVLTGGEKSAHFEEAYGLLSGLPECGEEILRANAKLRRWEGKGLMRGEGEMLARMLGGGRFAFWRAYSALNGLYYAFFRYGFPRRYFVPDYAARARSAGVSVLQAVPPAPEEYAKRAARLETARPRFLREMRELYAGRQSYARAVHKLAGEAPPRGGHEALRFLPERCPRSLTAVMRDFGLMELP